VTVPDRPGRDGVDEDTGLAHSCASVWLSEIMPAFAAVALAAPGQLVQAKGETMLMIRPPKARRPQRLEGGLATEERSIEIDLDQPPSIHYVNVRPTASSGRGVASAAACRISDIREKVSCS